MARRHPTLAAHLAEQPFRPSIRPGHRQPHAASSRRIETRSSHQNQRLCRSLLGPVADSYSEFGAGDHDVVAHRLARLWIADTLRKIHPAEDGAQRRNNRARRCQPPVVKGTLVSNTIVSLAFAPNNRCRLKPRTYVELGVPRNQVDEAIECVAEGRTADCD